MRLWNGTAVAAFLAATGTAVVLLGGPSSHPISPPMPAGSGATDRTAIHVQPSRRRLKGKGAGAFAIPTNGKIHCEWIPWKKKVECAEPGGGAVIAKPNKGKKALGGGVDEEGDASEDEEPKAPTGVDRSPPEAPWEDLGMVTNLMPDEPTNVEAGAPASSSSASSEEEGEDGNASLLEGSTVTMTLEEGSGDEGGEESGGDASASSAEEEGVSTALKAQAGGKFRKGWVDPDIAADKAAFAAATAAAARAAAKNGLPPYPVTAIKPTARGAAFKQQPPTTLLSGLTTAALQGTQLLRGITGASAGSGHTGGSSGASGTAGDDQAVAGELGQLEDEEDEDEDAAATTQTTEQAVLALTAALRALTGRRYGPIDDAAGRLKKLCGDAHKVKPAALGASGVATLEADGRPASTGKGGGGAPMSAMLRDLLHGALGGGGSGNGGGDGREGIPEESGTAIGSEAHAGPTAQPKATPKRKRSVLAQLIKPNGDDGTREDDHGTVS